MPDQVLPDVPSASVGAAVQLFISRDKATHVEVIQQADGKFTIKATIP